MPSRPKEFRSTSIEFRASETPTRTFGSRQRCANVGVIKQRRRQGARHVPQAQPLSEAQGFAQAKPQRDRQVALAPAKLQRAKGAPPPPVHYPVEDGEPMESGLHRRVSIDTGTMLDLHNAGRPDAYVGGNCFMYPEEGKPKVFVAPDIFVAYGVPKEPPRDVWKVWEEGKAPDFILELASRSTRDNDGKRKKDLYESLEVTEYWQFDPTGDYLDPILKGRALGADGRYRELELEERDGGLCCLSEVLGLDLRVEEGRLRFFDPKRGVYLQAAEEQRRTIQDQRRALEEKDRALKAAEARIRELERQRRPEG